MKKFTSILCVIAMLAIPAVLTGCNSGGTSDNPDDRQLSSPVSDSNSVSDSSDVPGGADSSDSGVGGNITFFPDAGSSVKIPMTYFDRNDDNGKARHSVWSEFGWYGDRSWLALGNIADIDSELREGDRFVKVKVTVEDIKLDYCASAVIKDIELV